MRTWLVCAIAALSGFTNGVPASAYTLSNTYYEDSREEFCNSTICAVEFALPSATTGKFLNVHYISCLGDIAKVLQGAVVAISDGGFTNIRRTQALQVAGTQVGGSYYWRNAVEMKVAGGPPRAIRVSIRGAESGSIRLICTITGELSAQ